VITLSGGVLFCLLFLGIGMLPSHVMMDEGVEDLADLESSVA
jgi:hypothetical protein